MSKSKIIEVYCDAGCICNVRSPVGISWAYCHVDDKCQISHSLTGMAFTKHWGVKLGLKDPPTGNSYLVNSLNWTWHDANSLTNNFGELIAALYALLPLPDNWQGTFYSDSDVTIKRLFEGAKMTAVPAYLQEWVNTTGKRFHDGGAKIKPVLLKGHPNADELEAGRAKDGLPVSIFNIWCDEQCTKQVEDFKNDYMNQEQIGAAKKYNGNQKTTQRRSATTVSRP